MQGLAATPFAEEIPVLRGIPRLPERHLSRQRLLQPLLQSRCVLSLLCAPAGYGKTTLLSEAAAQRERQGDRVLWMSLQGAEVSTDTFFSRLASRAGIDPASCDVPATLLRLLRGNSTGYLLVLDGLPARLPEAVDRWVEQLLAGPWGRLRLMVGSRTRPCWNLPGLALNGQLQEFSIVDLALRMEEAEQWQGVSGRAAGDTEDWQPLWRATNGWIAGLRLLQAGPAQGCRLLQDYLEREVLSGLGSDESVLLAMLAHLPRFTAQLCEELWEGDGRRLFENLLHANALLLPVEGAPGWYCLPDAVARVLGSRLEAPQVGHTRLRACRWLSGENRLDDAISLALDADQPEMAISYLQRLELDWQQIQTRAHDWLQWRQRLPEEWLESSPELVCRSTLALISNARLVEARRCLAVLGRFLPGRDAEENRRLLLHWQALQSALQVWECDIAKAALQAEEALSLLRDNEWSLNLLCRSVLARIAMVRGELALAARYLDGGLELARRADSAEGELLLQVDSLRLSFLQGKLDLSEALLDDSLRKRLAMYQRLPDPLTGRLYALRCEWLTARGQLAEAALSGRLALCYAGTQSAPLVFHAHLLLAEIAAQQGDHVAASVHLYEAERQMHCQDAAPVFYEAAVALQRLRGLAHQGRWRELLHRADTQGPGTLRSTPASPWLSQQLQLLLAEAEAHLGRAEQARSRLRCLEQHCQAAGFRTLAWRARALLQRTLAVDEVPSMEGLELEDLTDREAAVLRLLAKGLSNQEVGNSLYISVNTVKYHAKNINIKLGAKRRTQAIVIAKSKGLLA
jgi:ATP/maltotriose-dependent transcriptional regulator MalT